MHPFSTPWKHQKTDGQNGLFFIAYDTLNAQVSSNEKKKKLLSDCFWFSFFLEGFSLTMNENYKWEIVEWPTLET